MSRPVLAALLLVALAGCSTPEKSNSLPPLTPAPATSSASGPAGDAPGSPGPSGSAAPGTPSPTASVAPVVRPPEADRPDGAGAEAFARYWYAELNAAYDSMKTDRLAAVSQPSCQTCQNYIESIDRAKREGERYEGGEVTIMQTVPAPPDNEVLSVLVNYNANEGKAYDRDNHLILNAPARTNAAVDFQAKRAGDHWVAAEVFRAQ